MPSQSSRLTRHVVLPRSGPRQATPETTAVRAMCMPVCVSSLIPADLARLRASVLVNGPSSARAAPIAESALSCLATGRPSCSRRRLDHRSMPGSNSGSHQPASSVGIRWIVIRITQVRSSDRSSVRARVMSEAVSFLLRERKVSGPA